MHPPIIDQNQLIYAERERFLRQLPAELRDEVGAADEIDLSADDYFANLDDLHQEFHDDKYLRAHIQASPAGGQWHGDELIIRACEWARRHQTRVQIHLLEPRLTRAPSGVTIHAIKYH